MKSKGKQNSRPRIQYQRAFGQRPNEAGALGPTAAIQEFKLRWTPTHEGHTAVPDESAKAGPACSEGLAEPRIVPFEVICEQIRQRNEAKTQILREALQRSECSQTRFWGINE